MQPSGLIKKVKGDFESRHGVTQEPLADLHFCVKNLHLNCIMYNDKFFSDYHPPFVDPCSDFLAEDCNSPPSRPPEVHRDGRYQA